MRAHVVVSCLTTLVLVLFGGFFRAPSAQSVGSCEPSDSEAFLDVNNVRARIPNNGVLFYHGRRNVYTVPRFGDSNAVFAGGLWTAGQAGGELRAAAAMYSRYDFWAGPLDETGQPPDNCAAYDRVFRVSRDDLDRFEQTGIAMSDLRDWPTGLGAPTIDADGNPIDLLDQQLSARKNRLIDLAAGDRGRSIRLVDHERSGERA